MERRSFLKRAGAAIAGIPLVGGLAVAKGVVKPVEAVLGPVKTCEPVELPNPDKYYIRITDAGGRYIEGVTHPKLYTHIQIYDQYHKRWISYILIEPGQNIYYSYSIPKSVRFNEYWNSFTIRLVHSEMRTLDNFHGLLEVCGKCPNCFRTIS